MTATKTTVGAFDALEKARDDEPTFTLIARDPCAPATVTEWCRLRRNRAYKLYGHSKRAADKKLLEAELVQCADAEAVALAFDEWRKEEGEGQPGLRASYQDVKRSEAEIAEAATRDRREKLIRHLREADYHVCEARDGLIDMDLVGPVTLGDLAMMMARLKGIAEELTPLRPGVAPTLDLQEPGSVGL